MLEEVIGRLKDFIVSYTFRDEEEEIHFFKKSSQTSSTAD